MSSFHRNLTQSKNVLIKKETKHAFGFQREQMTGIEPASPAWEAGILPMNYICMVSCGTLTPSYFSIITQYL